MAESSNGSEDKPENAEEMKNSLQQAVSSVFSVFLEILFSKTPDDDSSS